MNKEVKMSPLTRAAKRLIALQFLIDDSFEFGLISEEDWRWHRKTIEVIITSVTEKTLKEMEEYGDKAGN